MSRIELVNGVLKTKPDPSGTLPPIYDETTAITSTITAGTSVTLPNSGSYTVGGKDLEIYVNGTRQTIIYDYNELTSTTVSFTYDLLDGDLVRFIKIRNP